jgi:hypothetical protein
MVNGDVVGVELGSATWWRGFHGLRRFGCLGWGRGRGLWLSFQCEDAHLSPSISSFHYKRKQNKSGILLVFDFLAPVLRVNFLLAGKQSLISATTELKLFRKEI